MPWACGVWAAGIRERQNGERQFTSIHAIHNTARARGRRCSNFCFLQYNTTTFTITNTLKDNENSISVFSNFAHRRAVHARVTGAARVHDARARVPARASAPCHARHTYASAYPPASVCRLVGPSAACCSSCGVPAKMKATARRRLSALQSALSHDRQLLSTTDVASGPPYGPPWLPMTTTQATSNWSSIAEACALFRSGACTPTDLLEACFARIDATESTYNSFVLQTRAAALAAAAASTERWRKGQQLSALDGIPMGIKDIYDTAGVCTAGGCYAYRNRVPTEDCAVVARLKTAGAVLVGKTFTVEFASGGLLNPQYRDEVTTNPWDSTKQPGGSSSGSAAAVAGGQVLIATGSCTGGSIRGPAAYCGLTGFVRVHEVTSQPLLPPEQLSRSPASFPMISLAHNHKCGRVRRLAQI